MKKSKFEKAPVPAYMMSYGDMMTLLLTFFILLVSMAAEQRAGFVAAGRKSFIRALRSGGLPALLPSGRKPLSLGHPKSFFLPSKDIAKSAIVQKADPNRRVLDAVESKLRRDFVVEFRKGHDMAMPTNISFVPGELRVTRQSLTLLNQIIRMAQIGNSDVVIESHVAQGQDRSMEDSFAFSARRAQVVADYLRRKGRISPERITAVGYGSFRPLVGSRQKGQGQSNERITIIFAKPAQLASKGT